jgi:hypothetical protein
VLHQLSIMNILDNIDVLTHNFNNTKHDTHIHNTSYNKWHIQSESFSEWAKMW